MYKYQLCFNIIQLIGYQFFFFDFEFMKKFLVSKKTTTNISANNNDY